MDSHLQAFHEEAQFLWLQRCHAVDAPHYSPAQFADLDDQLSAQLDGLMDEPQAAWDLCLQSLPTGDAPACFVAAVLAIDHPQRCAALLEQAGAQPELSPGLASALGWVGARRLGNVVTDLLASRHGWMQALGIAACGMHRQDPGAALATWLEMPSGTARARALRAAGELGRTDLLPRLREALNDPSPEARYWAAWSVALLGDHDAACPTLRGLALTPGRRQREALQTFIFASDWQHSHEVLAELDGLPDALRLRIMGAGCTGNPRYVPWLLDLMAVPATARIAAEAFVLVTGVDVNAEQLETLPPEGHEDGPSDDPEDEDVGLPEDVALPWLDVERARNWWSEHRAGLPSDRRLLLGAPPDERHCRRILKTGFQRQRRMAAWWQSASAPGTPLFPTAAPAWRQRRWMCDWPA